MSINQRLLILAITLALAACKSTPEIKTPEKVYIPVYKYVPVPEELTRPCPIENPVEMAVREAVRVATARKYSLLKCNEDKAAIRRISGESVESTSP